MKVLITLADVEPAVRLNALLEQDGDIETAVVSPFDDVPGAVRRERPDVLVLTGELRDPSNVALVRQAQWDFIPVVGIDDGDPSARERLRGTGFTEVYPKSAPIGETADGVRRVIDRQRLARMTGLIGESGAIREVLVKVEQMAPVSSTVLIEGESGTGKELVARAIHRLSPRRERPFIAVNVGALAETLLESELFGHEKGAFTGAAERRLGRFELADTGTLFLDEIGEVPPTTQVKLLRALEEREVMRVGGTQPFRVDVRVVAATNQPLREMVLEGRFRSDLYYRLNVLTIYLPPLRERREDIPLLVRRFVAEFAARHDRPFHGLSADALGLLVAYDWPGNVRELRNLIESMVVLAPGREIGSEDLPRHIRDGGSARLMPVPVGPLVRARAGTEGRELEFIVRSMVELKLQVEELRRRIDDQRGERARLDARADARAEGRADARLDAHAGDAHWIAEVRPAASIGAGYLSEGIVPQDRAPPPNVVTISPGMTMAEIERAAIEAALKETRGNRRRAAEMLGIGERTLYRKLREYQIPDVEEVHG